MTRSVTGCSMGINRYARAGLLVLVLTEAAIGFGQVVENPARPLSPNPGRVLKLTEIVRITDDGGEFFFKSPSDLRIADDGSILVGDASAEQFLKFSPEGRFLKNLYKKGQGPGELGGDFLSFQYYPQAKDIFVLDFSTQRFWRTDADGVFQEQISLVNKNYGDFFGVLPAGFLLLKTTSPDVSERTGRLLEVPHTVVLVDRGGREVKEICTFRPRSFYGNQMGMFWDPFVATLSPDGKTLYVCHGRDYLIEAVDVAAGRIVRSFKRQYPKAPHAEQDYESEFQKKYNTPKIEYEPDIKKLCGQADRLWVETSTDDKMNGPLIDVFDKDGRFVDSFYLGAGRTLMAVQEGFLFTQEKSEDGTISLVKYRIGK